MSNHKIFFYPGRLLSAFALSLFNYSVHDVSASVHDLLSLLFAIWFWIVALKLLIALIRRLTGSG